MEVKNTDMKFINNLKEEVLDMLLRIYTPLEANGRYLLLTECVWLILLEEKQRRLTLEEE